MLKVAILVLDKWLLSKLSILSGRAFLISFGVREREERILGKVHPPTTKTCRRKPILYDNSLRTHACITYACKVN